MSAQKDNDEDILPLEDVSEVDLDTEDADLDESLLLPEEEEEKLVSEEALLDDLL